MVYNDYILVKIPEYVKDELKEFAEKNGISMSEVVRKAIDEYLLNRD